MKFIKSKYFKIIFSIFLTVGFTYLIIRYIDFKFFFEEIHKVKYYFLIIASICLILSFIIRAIRFELLLEMKNKITFFFLSTMHYLLNKTLPARMGEASLPILLKRHLNVEYQKGISILLFFRVQDIFVMVFFLLISLFFIDYQSINFVKIILFSLSGIIFLALFWFFFSKICDFLIFLISKIKIKFLSKIISELINSLTLTKEFKESRSSKFLISNLLIAAANWFFLYLYYFFLLLAFGLKLNFFQSVFGVSVANFSFVIPNSVGNIGPFETGWGIGFYILGISKDIAIPIGLFANLFSTIVSLLFVAFSYVAFKIWSRNYFKVHTDV